MIGWRPLGDLQLGASAVFGWIDPNLRWQRLRRRHSTHEALGVRRLGFLEHATSSLEDVVGLSVVDHRRRQVGDARVTVLGVVPRQEMPAPGAGVLVTAEALRIARRVLQRLELRLEDGATKANT